MVRFNITSTLYSGIFTESCCQPLLSVISASILIVALLFFVCSLFLFWLSPLSLCVCMFFEHPSLTISLHCYWSSLVGHISPCLGKLPWGQGVRPHLDHPVQGLHGQGPRASIPQLDPQKQTIHPSCYGAGGSHWPGNSELSVWGRRVIRAYRGPVADLWLLWKYQMALILTTIWCNPQETSRSPAPPFSAWAFTWTARGVTCSVTRYRLFSVCETTTSKINYYFMCVFVIIVYALLCFINYQIYC